MTWRIFDPENPILDSTTHSARIDALESRVLSLDPRRNVPLAPMTTFGIGGPADLFVRATTPDALGRTLAAAAELGVPTFLLGKGANILVGDLGFRGLVVRCEIGGIEWVDEGVLTVGAGVEVFPDLTSRTVEAGFGGLHHFVGIPSTVGGALWQNLHFLSPPPERERTVFIEEVLESAVLLGADGSIRTVDVDYFRFGYDYSILHDTEDIVLTATFRLHPEPVERLREVVAANLEWRDARHPDLWLYPCAGSIFKKIEGIGAGRLIDECGLKGRIHENAQIFHKHANIIVNLGGATAAQVRHLISLAQETVAQETGYALEPEIRFVGEF